MLDKKQFVQILAGLCEMYGKATSEFIFDVYYEILKNYSDEQVKSAVVKCIRDHKYNTLPKPAHILEYIEGTTEDKALLAWMQVLEAFKRADYYDSLDFADPIISHCIVQLGGWQWLCSQEKSQLPFLEKRFLEIYRVLQKRGITEPVKVLGFIEKTNKETGHENEIPTPVKIGYRDTRKFNRTLPKLVEAK